MAIVVPPRNILQVTLPHVIAFLNGVGRGLVSTHDFQKLRASSWWRDRETNIRVGGQPDSQHLLGLALDIVGPTAVRVALAIELRGLGLTAIDELSHLHVQLLAAGQARAEGLFF